MSVVPGLGWPLADGSDVLASSTATTPVGWQGDVPRETLAADTTDTTDSEEAPAR